MKTRIIIVSIFLIIIIQSCEKEIRPTVKTLHPTNVTKTSVKFNGNVNPNGFTTIVLQFEYGLTSSYGNVCTVKNVSGKSPIEVNFEIPSGLLPDKIYHYRLVASNRAGPSLGEDEIFSTSNPPTLITYPASDITSTTVTLNGGINPNGGNFLVQFEYIIPTAFRSQAYDYVSGDILTNVSIYPIELEINTTYHYRINAYRQKDDAYYYGNVIEFTTKLN